MYDTWQHLTAIALFFTEDDDPKKKKSISQSMFSKFDCCYDRRLLFFHKIAVKKSLPYIIQSKWLLHNLTLNYFYIYVQLTGKHFKFCLSSLITKDVGARTFLANVYFELVKQRIYSRDLVQSNTKIVLMTLLEKK